MEAVVLFTRQRGACSDATEQEVLNAQVRETEAYAECRQLGTIDRIALAGISSNELFQKMVAYLSEHPSVRAIITYSADRLLRELNNLSSFEELLRERSIKGFFAREARTVTLHYNADQQGQLNDR